MMWAVLGEIEFEVLSSPFGWEERFGANFAEHERISDKPLLEAVGGVLNEISWDIRLHHELFDVASRIREIRNAAAASDPLVLVLGDGGYLGPWVIAEGTLVSKKTTAGGRIISADLNVLLREFTGELPIVKDTPGIFDNLAKPTLLNAIPEQAISVVNQVATAARTAKNAINGAVQISRDISELINHPSIIITKIPELISVTSVGQQAAQVMGTAAQISQDIVQIANAGQKVFYELQSVKHALEPINVLGLEDQLNEVNGFLDKGARELAKVDRFVNKLTSDIATRRV